LFVAKFNLWQFLKILINYVILNLKLLKDQVKVLQKEDDRLDEERKQILDLSKVKLVETLVEKHDKLYGECDLFVAL